MERMNEPIETIKILCQSQQVAVLSTQGEGQPYSNLVAFAESDDLRYLLFVTNRNTRKFSNITRDRKVAMLIDNRTNQPLDFENAVAVTVIGSADEIVNEEKEHLTQVYISKHPSLADFLHQPDNALLKITIDTCIIARFNRVERVRMAD